MAAVVGPQHEAVPTTLFSVHSQHHPSWFAGAPVSKGIAMFTVLVFIWMETTSRRTTNGRMIHDLALDADKIFNDAQFYRLATCHWTFASVAQLIMGLGVLCPLLRRFEREMGSRKFATFLLFKTALLATLIQSLLSLIFKTEYAPGPYPSLGALFFLFHAYTPRLYPRFFGMLGFDFSEKAITYAFAFQVMFSGGWSTVLPTASGFLAGYTSMRLWSEWELPEIVYTVIHRIFGSSFLVEYAPPVLLAAQRQQRSSRGGTRRIRIPSQFTPLPPMAPPPEAVEQLTMMGFERDAVVRALQASDNNLEAAANRLLSGS